MVFKIEKNYKKISKYCQIFSGTLLKVVKVKFGDC